MDLRLNSTAFERSPLRISSKVSLLSRNRNELGARFPEVAAAAQGLPVDECVIDGEVVALDEKGRSSFQLLQALEMEGRKSPVYYYVFDLLQMEGRNLMLLPLETRKALLVKLREGVGDLIRYSAEIGSDPNALLKEIKHLGLEGIVGKQRRSIYEQGRRSGAWIKLKCSHEQEFVIGGYTPPAGSRKYFGAILVGYYEGSGCGLPEKWEPDLPRNRSPFCIRSFVNTKGELPLRRSSSRRMGAGCRDHARRDAQVHLGGSGVCLPD